MIRMPFVRPRLLMLSLLFGIVVLGASPPAPAWAMTSTGPVASCGMCDLELVIDLALCGSNWPCRRDAITRSLSCSEHCGRIGKRAPTTLVEAIVSWLRTAIHERHDLAILGRSTATAGGVTDARVASRSAVCPTELRARFSAVGAAPFHLLAESWATAWLLLFPTAEDRSPHRALSVSRARGAQRVLANHGRNA